MNDTEIKEIMDAIDRIIPALVEEKVRGIVGFQIEAKMDGGVSR